MINNNDDDKNDVDGILNMWLGVELTCQERVDLWEPGSFAGQVAWRYTCKNRRRLLSPAKGCAAKVETFAFKAGKPCAHHLPRHVWIHRLRSPDSGCGHPEELPGWILEAGQPRLLLPLGLHQSLVGSRDISIKTWIHLTAALNNLCCQYLSWMAT